MPRAAAVTFGRVAAVAPVRALKRATVLLALHPRANLGVELGRKALLALVQVALAEILVPPALRFGGGQELLVALALALVRLLLSAQPLRGVGLPSRLPLFLSELLGSLACTSPLRGAAIRRSLPRAPSLRHVPCALVPADRPSPRRVPDLNPHDLRHSIASLWYREGVDKATIAARLGHTIPVWRRSAINRARSNVYGSAVQPGGIGGPRCWKRRITASARSSLSQLERKESVLAGSELAAAHG